MSSTPQLVLSQAWRLVLDDAVPRIDRPSDGASMEFDGAVRPLLADLWASLGTPTERSSVLSQLGRLGEGSELLEAFENEGVLRPVSGVAPPIVEGNGELAQVVRRIVSGAGWALPRIRVLEASELFGPSPMRSRTLVTLVRLPDGLVAVGEDCPVCAFLRALAISGSPGAEQTSQRESPSYSLTLSCLVAALLLDVEASAIPSHVGVVVRFECGVARGRFIEHPDCSACSRAAPYGVEWLRRELLRGTTEGTDEARIRSVFGDSPFAPIVVNEVERDAGQLPFDAPYVFGDTRLSRRRGNRVFCTSLPGIVHGSAPDVRRSRLLAWSEGVERLSAQSARPEPPGTALVRGLDLIRDVECSVSCERVGVMVPSDATDGVPREKTFTGVASHVSCTEAILHGTVELLKRDAYMIAWYRMRRLGELRLPSELPPELEARRRYLVHHGLSLRVYDLRSELPLPTVLLHVRAGRRVGNWPEGGSLLVPAGGFTPLEALRHALSLACSRFVGLGLDASPEHDPLDARATEQLGRTLPFWPALARYFDPDRAEHLEFLFGEESADLNDIASDAISTEQVPARQRFELLRAWLATAKLGWIAVSLTDEHVVRAGLRVIKSFVPQAVRLVLEADEVDRNNPRLCGNWPGSAGEWNPEPHPVY